MDFTPYNGSFLLEVQREGDLRANCSSVAISEVMILTAAHCLEGVHKVSVKVNGVFKEAKSWQIHPRYDKHESNYNFDVGVIHLRESLPSDIHIPKIGRPSPNILLERIGFGERKGMNLRTHISGIRFLEREDWSICLKDKFGVPGDSGGPIYQWQMGELVLIGIHSTVLGEKSFSPLIFSLL